jgi:hypothetical protein
MYPKVGLVEETKGRKKGKNDSKKQWNTSHLCRNKIQQNTLKAVKQHRIGGKGQGSVEERGYIVLSTMCVQL